MENITEEVFKIHIEEPKQYNVVMYNDNRTTMEFVEYILCNIFEKSPEESHELMLTIHKGGCGIAGTYNRDGAVTRASESMDLARSNGYPLRVEVEEV